MIKLHLGCGRKYIPGFIHIDLSDYDHIDHKHDIRSLPMINSDSVDLIYACHVITYFDRVEIVDVMKEWRRVLTTGGILRLSVTDFRVVSRLYNEGYTLDSIVGPVFGRWDTGNGIVYHKTVYDYGSLESMLTKNGFSNVRWWNWRETIHKDYDDYSQAYLPWTGVVDDEFKNGTLISLNVECQK